MDAPPLPPEGNDRSYAEELVYTTAEDGVTLEGAVIRPRIPFARVTEQHRTGSIIRSISRPGHRCRLDARPHLSLLQPHGGGHRP